MTKIVEQQQVTHWARDPETGVRYPVCSIACAKRFMVVTAVRCESLEWRSDAFRPRHWCSHCSSCSQIITRPEPTDGAYIQTKEVFVAYLLLTIVLAGLIYAGWRLTRMTAARPKTRVIGPDDDPDFLRRLGHGDNPRT